MRLSFFRSFFPTWSFFSHLGPVPLLYYRYEENSLDSDRVCIQGWSSWMTNKNQNVSFGRRLLELFHNPHGNSELAIQGVLIQFLEESLEKDLNVSKNLKQSTSYQIIQRYVFSQVKGFNPKSFQFKILAYLPETQAISSEDLYQSSPCKVFLADGISLEIE